MTSRGPILVTGFDPFDLGASNPSRDLVVALTGRVIRGRRVVGRTLPVVFGRAAVALRAALAEERPDLVLCLGLAGNRTAISVERVAINVDDARIPDNAGNQPIDTPIVPGGPAAYWSTLPIKAVVAAMVAAKIPAEVSQTAGTYVCNHVFFHLMDALRAHPGCRGGFMHVPWPTAALPLAGMQRAVEIAIAATLDHTGNDARASGGALA